MDGITSLTVVDFGPAVWFPDAEALKIKRSFGGLGFKRVSTEKTAETRKTIYKTPDGDRVELLENPIVDIPKYCREGHPIQINYFDKNGNYKPLFERFPGHDHSPL
jgi:hypothetical protein